MVQKAWQPDAEREHLNHTQEAGSRSRMWDKAVYKSLRPTPVITLSSQCHILKVPLLPSIRLPAKDNLFRCMTLWKTCLTQIGTGIESIYLKPKYS